VGAAIAWSWCEVSRIMFLFLVLVIWSILLLHEVCQLLSG